MDELKKGDGLEIDGRDDDAGTAFLNAVQLVVNRKFSRNNIYRDNWYDRNRITYHTDRIDSKAVRIKQAEDLFFAGELTLEQLLVILEEEAGDIAVYALFVLARIKKLKKEIDKKQPLGAASDIEIYLTGRIR